MRIGAVLVLGLLAAALASGANDATLYRDRLNSLDRTRPDSSCTARDLLRSGMPRAEAVSRAVMFRDFRVFYLGSISDTTPSFTAAMAPFAKEIANWSMHAGHPNDTSALLQLQPAIRSAAAPWLHCGFALAQAEGDLYPAQNPATLLEFAPQLPPALQAYLQFRAREDAQPLIEDACLQLTWEQLRERLARWEAFARQHPELPETRSELEPALHDLASLYFFGSDNTPTFNPHTGHLDPKLIDSWRSFSALNRDSKYWPLVQILLPRVTANHGKIAESDRAVFDRFGLDSSFATWWRSYRLRTLTSASAPPHSSWILVRNSHFEIYSQAGAAAAQSALAWFEQLRAFIEQTGVRLSPRAPLRVVGFRSVKDYDSYRLHSTADAFYIGTETRGMIVMPSLTYDRFPMAAHEYAHAVLHASGVHPPTWLSEGVAEFLSTVRIGSRGCEIGGDLPAHSQTLRRASMPLSQLWAVQPESLARQTREQASVFYAQSWALTEMLVLSPPYRVRFRDFLSALATGVPDSVAFAKVYSKSPPALESDLRAWRESPQSIVLTLPGVAAAPVAAQTSVLSPFDSRVLMADLLSASGDFDRAEALYRDLALESPKDARIPAALGEIAFRRGDRDRARRYFQSAISLGLADAGVCYRYVALAEAAGMPEKELRPALERTVALQPDFDDARYKLALFESNAGNYDAAVSQLRAMKTVSPARAFAYWSALANALNELNRRQEADAAADQAMQHASTQAERAEASRLSYIAQTDLTVQFSRDSNGQLQLVTTRAPHGAQDWNPFVEPGDRLRHADGQLLQVECGGNKMTGIQIATRGGPLKLAIPDPTHVLLRNGPSEFMCGPQPASKIAVDYAASAKGAAVDGILRAMDFR